MSIINHLGIFTATCDDCDETFESGYDDRFDTFIAELKALGWTMGNVRGEWWHKCQECSDPSQDFPEVV